MSGPREVPFESLIGRRVCDANGESIGRIEDICAGDVGGELAVRFFLVGPFGAASRLLATNVLLRVLRLLGISTDDASYIVPWEAMDLSDPEHPRAHRVKAELERRD